MKNINVIREWYEEKKTLYESLAKKVEAIIADKIKQHHINYHSVVSRVKDVDKFVIKAENAKYTDPQNQIKDMAGIRVITYLESDVAKVAKIIEELFAIDKANSVDQSSLLGSDKVGYRSVHYVATLGNRRTKLPEYKEFSNLCFEIQIRSLLQHAWAEIEHDRNYKFTGALPSEISRRFYLLAGMLELADREFVSIDKAIDKYKSHVTEEIIRADLDLEINTISLEQYLSHKFPRLMKIDSFMPMSGDTNTLVVEELNLFGINRISELDKVIPSDYQDYAYKKYRDLPGTQSFVGYIRDILLINDAAKYFEKSWRKNWYSIDSLSVELLKHYNVDIVKYMNKYGLDVVDI